MSVTSVEKDVNSLTITLVADFQAPIERVWQLWADPRQLERWWGPPGYPSTFEKHEFAPGGDVTYYMTSPEGEKYFGWWRMQSVAPPSNFEFLDGFADNDGQPNAEMPVTTVRVDLSTHAGGTRMEMRSLYDSLEQMEKVVAMGAIEGISLAVGQMDALLAE